MIEKNFLQKLATRYQTREENVIREYLQHLFLSLFYRQGASKEFLFKGGTALKIIFGSPRFSEDIDFSGTKDSVLFEKLLERVLLDFALEGINCDLEESKRTSGGHLVVLRFGIFGKEIEIRNEISFRKKKSIGRVYVVTSDLVPAYHLYGLKEEELVKEKLHALLARKKSRDIFDLYFILRSSHLRKHLKMSEIERKKLLEFLKEGEKKKIESDLKPLLPQSFAQVIKKLPEFLLKEL